MLFRSRDRTSARIALGVPEDRFLVSVIGGSLGSRLLNESILRFVGDFSDDRGLAVHHVVGERFVDEHRASGGVDRDGSSGVWYRVVGYEERMADVYAASDLMIGRGGAGTVADVATVGVPSILVPWSGATDDHQRGNIRWLSDDGAAVLLDESEVGDAFAAATAYVQPSANESFSRTIMEAWLAGTLVLATDASAVLRWHCERSGAGICFGDEFALDRKSTRLNSSH